MKKHDISAEWEGSRVDRFVRAALPGLSFAAVQTMLRRKMILLNGKRAKGSERLSAGDTVEIDAAGTYAEKAPDPGDLEPLKKRWGIIGREIAVLYEDASILAVDKPSGLVVQPGNDPELGSMLDLLADYAARSGTGQEQGPDFSPAPAHRLDRETSGVLIAAKTRGAARSLSVLFREGGVEKRYIAVTEGIPDPPEGEIDTPISTEKDKRSTSRTDSGGLRAITTYKVLRELSGTRALVEIGIHTGRTHQIRVHMASIGYPLEGDTRYGETETAEGRLMLHAWKVRLSHPESGEALEIVSPIPGEFMP